MADNFLNNWTLERLLTWLIEKIRQTWVFCPNKQTKKNPNLIWSQWMLIFKRSLGILQSLFTVIPPEYESLCNCWSKHQAQELFPRTKPFSLGHDVFHVCRSTDSRQNQETHQNYRLVSMIGIATMAALHKRKPLRAKTPNFFNQNWKIYK